MTEERKYFIFNKPMDYRRGTACGMTFQDGRLRQTGGRAGMVFLTGA